MTKVSYRWAIDPSYHIDPDNAMVLEYFEAPLGSRVLEVGANDSHVADVLVDHGYKVTGIDLRAHTIPNPPPKYQRLIGDFVQMGHLLPEFDLIFSASAIEHFGLGTYHEDTSGDQDYDQKALALMWRLLKPKGFCLLTVPYGKNFEVHGKDWRVYDHVALHQRLVQNFKVVEKVFFKSAECNVPDDNGIVTQEAADQFVPGELPHLTVFLKLQKEV